MPLLKASAQYNDWVGSAAADKLDKNDLVKLLRQKDILGEDEFLVGVEFSLGEPRASRERSVDIGALITQRGDFETVKAMIEACGDKIPLRRVTLELSLEEFLATFKRFSIVLTHRGLDLAGKEYVDTTFR